MRELSYQITVDERGALQALGRVDAAQRRVETGAVQMGTAIDRGLSAAEAEFARIDKAFKAGEASAKEYAAAVSTLAKAQSDAKAATDKTATAVQGADKATQEATKSAGAMSSALQGVGRTIMAAFAVERMVSFGRSAIAAAVDVKTLAERTGLSTRAVQELGYAAQMSGTSIDTVAGAIGTMSRNLVDGNKGAVGALQQLGLAHRDLQAMQPEQAFLGIADAIGKMRDPMERATAAQHIFGQQGKDLLPGIAQGYRNLVDEAKRFGVAVEKENVEALAEFNASWIRAEIGFKATLGNMLGSLFRFYDALDRYFAGKDGTGNWGRQSARALIDQTPLALFYSDSSTGPDSWRRSVLGQGRTDAMSAMPGALATDLDDRLAIKIPEPVIQSYRTLGKTFKDSADSVQSFLRSVTVAIGVNRDLRLDPTHPFARTGIAGAIVDANTNPFLPSSNPLSMTGLPGDIRGGSGFSGYTPPAGPGFWAGRGGQAVGAGIGVAGGAAIGAMAGGDSAASFIGAGASAVSYAALPAAMGTAALGAATMGIGAAAVGVYMLAKHFTTVSKEVKQARVDIAEFQQELWRTATRTQMADAAGRDWAATTIVVRDAYARMGKTAAEAEQDVLGLWDDRHPERARLAMQSIAGVMDDLRSVLAEANTEMSTLLSQATELATRLPGTLLDQLQSLVDRGDLTDGNAALVRQLQSASAIDFDRFKARADALGLDPNALGSAFAQHQTTKTAQQYIDDLDLFRRAGVTDGTILSGMQEELSALVQEAIRFNTELPNNMQPWIAELQRAGLLVDENGEKLEDLSSLKWGEALETSTDRLIASIQELIDTLNGPLQQAFNRIPAEVRTRLIVDRDDLPDPQDRQRPQGLQYGGVVYAAQGFVARGTDTVPAMLTPGEGVLSRQGMAMLGALNGGQAAGAGLDYERLGAAVARALRAAGVGRITVDGRDLSDRLVPHIGPALREAGAWR